MRFQRLVAAVFVSTFVMIAWAGCSGEDTIESDLGQPAAPVVKPAGFGCHGPTNRDEYECDRHCKDSGFTGGYCNALTGWLRCDCYR